MPSPVAQSWVPLAAAGPDDVLHSHAEPDRSKILHRHAEPQRSGAESLAGLRLHLAESGTVLCPIGLACPYSVNELPAAKQLETDTNPEAACKQYAAGLPAASPRHNVELLRV